MKNIVPFGKYKDQPVDLMLQDFQYMNWLQAQPWFAERYPTINTLIYNNYGEPSETPEHNAMQALFFTLPMQQMFARYLMPDEFILSDKEFRDSSGYKRILVNYAFNLDDVEFKIQAECGGFDVYLTMHVDKEFMHEDIKYYRRDGAGVLIELKPTMGDDYPAVLRQIQTNMQRALRTGFYGRLFLIVKEYTGQAVDLEVVKQIFKASDIQLILLKELI